MTRHLHVLPDPEPRASVLHLQVLILNAAATFGGRSSIVAELRAKLRAAERALARTDQLR